MSIIIFDTETTGLQKPEIVPLEQHPKIVEFAGIKLNSKTLKEEGRFEFLCNPECEIPQEVIRVHHITNEMVKDKKTFAEKSIELEKFFEDCDAAVAHNIAFDKYMIDTEYKRMGKVFNWPKKLICTVNRTYSLLGYRLSLSKLYDYLFHQDFADKHRAMGDIEALTQCFIKLVEDKILEI